MNDVLDYIVYRYNIRRWTINDQKYTLSNRWNMKTLFKCSYTKFNFIRAYHTPNIIPINSLEEGTLVYDKRTNENCCCQNDVPGYWRYISLMIMAVAPLLFLDSVSLICIIVFHGVDVGLSLGFSYGVLPYVLDITGWWVLWVVF